MTFRQWVMTLLEYDNHGNATIVKSFTKPAKESSVKQGYYAKKQPAKKETVIKKLDVVETQNVLNDDIL